MLKQLLFDKIYIKNILKSHVPPYEKYFGSWVLIFQNFPNRHVLILSVGTFVGFVWLETELQMKNSKVKLYSIFLVENWKKSLFLARTKIYELLNLQVCRVSIYSDFHRINWMISWLLIKKNYIKNLAKSHVPHPMKIFLEVGFSNFKIFRIDFVIA